MSIKRLVLVVLATALYGIAPAAAQTSPLDLDRNTRMTARAMAAKARAVQAPARERERERDQDDPAAGPSRFFERLFGGLPPMPPAFQLDLGAVPEPGYGGRRQYQASINPEIERPIDPKYLPQTVAYDGAERPGTIIIDTAGRFLYLVQEDGRAKRYGVGVGRAGFTWSGVSQISAKREWPDWIPPEDMLRRRPDLPHFMAGGPENPLGARAMYLGSSLYRIHGSNEPWSIGTAVSSGCIRMRNEDVIELYQRVKIGTKVVVI